MMYSPRGFALLISIILTSVVLAVGIALLDIAYKQVLLSSGAKNSQYAFYNADSALECALYWDQRNAFAYINPLSGGSIVCDTRAVTSFASNISGSNRVTTFAVACATGGTSANVTIYKDSSGITSMYSNGYNTCDASNAARIERGIKINY